MGVGHIALALGASKGAPRVNVGWLVFAALLSDFLLGIFASLGWEHATVPEGYATKHYLLFNFPYSHGLLSLLVWAAIFGFLVSRIYGFDRGRILLVVALVVLSHFLLDGIVHIAGLPLLGNDSPKLGLGLWKHLPLELGLETLMSVVGIAVYWKLAGSSGSVLSRYGMATFVLIITLLTWTQLTDTVPPPEKVLKITWIAAPLAFAAIPYFLDRRRVKLALALSRTAVPKP